MSSLRAQKRSSLTDSVPQRYPSCAASCRGWSMRSCEGSCAGGTETRSCRSGSGRSCCHHGCRACPVYAVSTAVPLHAHCMPISCPVRCPAVSASPMSCVRAVLQARCEISTWAGATRPGARQNAPCQGRSSGRRRSRRRYACWRCWR